MKEGLASANSFFSTYSKVFAVQNGWCITIWAAKGGVGDYYGRYCIWMAELVKIVRGKVRVCGKREICVRKRK